MKQISFSFGRFNPPTIAHQLLFKRLEAENGLLVVSETHDSKRNPLSTSLKIDAIQEAHPNLHCRSSKNPYLVLEELAKDYQSIKFYCGEDRIEGFQSMHKYKEQFGFKNLEIISIGNRNDLGTHLEQVSATKARQYAYNGDFENFKKIIAQGITTNTTEQMFHIINRTKDKECQTKLITRISGTTQQKMLDA